MKKQTAIGIAASVLGFAGVASASMSVQQFTSNDRQGAAISIEEKQAAANCWLASGAVKTAGCVTSFAAPSLALPGLPGLPEVPGVDLGFLTGLTGHLPLSAVDPTDPVGTVTGVVDTALAAAGPVTGMVPVPLDADCALAVAGKVPYIGGVFAPGLDLIGSLQSFAAANLNVPVPVDLPVDVLGTIDDVKGQIGCVAGDGDVLATGGTAATGAVNQAGTAATGAINQAGTAATGAVNTATNAATNAVGTATNAATNAVGTATNAVGGVLDTAGSAAGTAGGLGGVTDTADDLLGGLGGVLDTVTGLVPTGILPTGTPDCEASGSASILNILGSLTASCG